MNWHWPQWTYAILMFLTFCGYCSNHGKPRENYDVGTYLINAALSLAVLYFGGFWTP